MLEKAALAALGLILAAIAVFAAATTPLHYEDGFKNVSLKRATVITQTDEMYGTNSLQVVTLRRNLALNAVPTKTVIFLHGGGWNAGGRGSLDAEAIEWAKTGWVSINVSYRTGIYNDGITGDGSLILDDVLTVLDKYRVKSYVDPDKIVVYGESAGGHLAEWLGSKYGSKVKAFVAISPVSSISGAILAGQQPGAPDNVKYLGVRAEEFFGYSVGTTDSHRYLDRVQHAFIALSTDEWVDPDIHGRKTCLALGSRCEAHEFAGSLHAGLLIDANPQLAVDARHWAGAQLP